MATRSMMILESDIERNPNTMLANVTRSDRVRVGSQWQTIDQLDWLHGFKVDEVQKQLGALADGTLCVGDTLQIYDLDNNHVYDFDVQSIEMCTLDEFDFAEAGYSDRDTFVRDNPMRDVARVWLMRGVKRHV